MKPTGLRKDFIRLAGMDKSKRIQVARTSPPHVIQDMLADKDVDVLMALLSNPRLKKKHLLMLIRRRNIPTKVLERVANSRKWTNQYQVKLELVRNPRSPIFVAFKYVKFLYRPDLVEVARNVNLPKRLREQAEYTLQVRLEALSEGEKVSLARMATAPLLALLIHDKSARVVDAVLKNPRLQERDVVVTVNSIRTDPLTLRLIADNPHWFNRYPIRMGLAYNALTPKLLHKEALEKLLYQDLYKLILTTHLSDEIRANAIVEMKIRLQMMSLSERIGMAEVNKSFILDMLIHQNHPRITCAALANPKIKIHQVRKIALNPKTPKRVLWDIAVDEKWLNSGIEEYIKQNPSLPKSLHD